MGILSSNVSITRYNVVGNFDEPVMENMTKILSQNAIVEIDNENFEKSSGWTSFEDHFKPDFTGNNFVIGSYFIFSFRIDKKVIPSKIVNKVYRQEVSKKLEESGREFLSRNEKKQIKEDVIGQLSLRIPATPNVFDIIWNFEKSILWFFSTQKTASEEFEYFFTKKFKLNLVRHFPYTAAVKNLKNSEKDFFEKIVPSYFME